MMRIVIFLWVKNFVNCGEVSLWIEWMKISFQSNGFLSMKGLDQRKWLPFSEGKSAFLRKSNSLKLAENTWPECWRIPLTLFLASRDSVSWGFTNTKSRSFSSILGFESSLPFHFWGLRRGAAQFRQCKFPISNSGSLSRLQRKAIRPVIFDYVLAERHLASMEVTYCLSLPLNGSWFCFFLKFRWS